MVNVNDLCVCGHIAGDHGWGFCLIEGCTGCGGFEPVHHELVVATKAAS